MKRLIVALLGLFLVTGCFAQCDVYITPTSAQSIDHNPGVSFSFEIQNNGTTPYSGGSLYMDWTLSGFVSGPIWDFDLGISPIPPGSSRYISTPIFDIPLPENVPGNWTPYGGWTGSSYISFFKLALAANGECFQWVLNSDGTWWEEPLSDGCPNPNGDIFCDGGCGVELIDFNLETGEITLIPYSTYCLNIGSPSWWNQYPYDDPFIFGFVLNFNFGGNSINVSIGGQSIYASNGVLIIDLDNPSLNALLESILESINSGETCELVLTIYNLNNTGQFIGYAQESQIIELINLCPPIDGCMDPEASNYNSFATIDDGSCLYDVLGCTDNSAINYNSLANIDDGSCEYLVLGCTDSFATNYNPLATLDDGTCEYIFYLEGCTDISATNYNEAAIIDNGSCVYDLCYAIWIPNVFSPNNDGVNDVWEIIYELDCWIDVEFNIFNRWGVKIYHGYGSSFDSYPFWDGRVRNRTHFVPDGIYYYSVVGRKANSPEVINESGHITIFR
tara:strand:- start:1200 stop:2711 length:1512 start_codon:yes stop_codon:yes gene_type:complete